MTPGKIATLTGGVAGHALAVLCWYLIYTRLHADILKLWINLIFPFGAVSLGLIGGLGFRIGARMMRQAATPGLAITAVIVAVVTCFVIRFCGYWTLEFNGEPIHRSIGFFTYVRETLGHTKIDFSHGTQGLGTFDIGAAGYFMELLQTAAYALISYAFVARLPKAVWCDVCERPMENRLSGEILYNDAARLQALLQRLPAGAAERSSALSEAPSDSDGPNTGAIKLTWRVARCSTCSSAVLIEGGAAFNGQFFVSIPALHRLRTFDRVRAAAPLPTEPSPVGPSGFGRRIVR